MMRWGETGQLRITKINSYLVTNKEVSLPFERDGEFLLQKAKRCLWQVPLGKNIIKFSYLVSFIHLISNDSGEAYNSIEML